MLSTGSKVRLDVPTVLVPSAIFVEGSEAEWLGVNNLRGVPVSKYIGCGVVAVMACREGVDAGNVGSLFEEVVTDEETTFYLTGAGRVYISVFANKKLMFLDAMPYSGAADLVYYAHEVVGARGRIRVKGLKWETKSAVRALRAAKFRARCA